MGEIRFVGIGEASGYPYLVCKKTFSFDKRPWRLFKQWRLLGLVRNILVLYEDQELLNIQLTFAISTTDISECNLKSSILFRTHCFFILYTKP